MQCEDALPTASTSVEVIWTLDQHDPGSWYNATWIYVRGRAPSFKRDM